MPCRQPCDVGDIEHRDLRLWFADGGGGDDAAIGKNMLPHGQPDAGLLLVPGQRQIGVENIVSLVDVAGSVRAANLDHHFRPGKTGHGAVGTARQLLRQKQAAAIAGQDGDAALVALVAGRTKRRQLG